MGKKIICRLAPRGRKSKDQGGGKKSKVVQLYTPLPLSGTDSPSPDVKPIAPICQRPKTSEKTANNHRSTSKATTTPLVHHIFESIFAADGVLDDADDVKNEGVNGKDDKIVVKANKEKKTAAVATKKELGGFS